MIVGRKPKARRTTKGRELTALRERLGLTQKQAAERIHASERAWRQWESGISKPTAAYLFLIQLLDQGKLP